MSDMYVADICQDIRAKFNYGEGGLDHGLLYKDEGVWLNPQKMLGHYDLKYQATLEFRKKHRVLKVKTLDSSIKAILVDESQNVNTIVASVCQRIGLANPEEYSFQRDQPETTDPKDKKKKAEQGGSLLDLEAWLNPDRTFREQGLSEVDVVVLKKKFFYSDQNVDRSDPVQLVLMYNQSREMVLTGKHPCTLEEAAQFGALQMQIDYGNHEPDKHKPGFLKLKSFAPPEYQKNKELEKKIYAEHRKLQGTSDLNAKFRYVQLIRSMKTYGVTFFSVKEIGKGGKKKTAVLLGVTKQSVLKMDQETKDIIAEWKLTQIRRWAATPKGFTLDFGDYADKYYNVETDEGEQISRLIAGYIDIIIKKRNQLTTAPEPKLEEQSVVEDYMAPAQAKNVAVVNSNSESKQVRAPEPHLATSKSDVTSPGVIPMDLDLLQGLDALRQRIRNALNIISACSRDLYTAQHIPQLSNDAQGLKWRQDATEINAAAVSAHIAFELGALSSLIVNVNGEPKDMDFDSIDSFISAVTSSITQTTQAWRMLAGLAPDDKVQELLSTGKALIDASGGFIESIDPIISGFNNTSELHQWANNVGTIASDVLKAINALDVSEDHQCELLKAAEDMVKAVGSIVDAARLLTENTPNTNLDDLNQDVELGSQVAPIVQTCASLLSSVVPISLCREKLVESAIIMRDAISAIDRHQFEGDADDLANALRRAIHDAEESLTALVEKARNIENDIDFEIEAYYDQVMGCSEDLMQNIDDLEKMKMFGKELVVNSTRLVEVLKIKVDLLEEGMEQDELAKDIETLSTAILAMVQAGKAARNKLTDDTKEEFLTTIDELQKLATFICEPYVRSNIAKNLIHALRSTMASSNHVIGAAKNAAPSNRDQAVQLQLNRAGKEVTERIPALAHLIRETRADPKEFVARYRLLKASSSFCEPATSLLTIAKSASSTTVETDAQLLLLTTAQKLTEDVIYLQKLCALMEEIMANEDVGCALESVNDIQANIKGIGVAGKSAEQSAQSDADLQMSSKRLQQAIHDLAESIQKGSSRTSQSALVDVISEYRNICKPLNAEFQTAGSDKEQEELRENALQLGNAIAALIQATNSNTVQKITKDCDRIIAGIMENGASSKALSIAREQILRVSVSYAEGRRSTISTKRTENPQRLLWAAANELMQGVNGLVSAHSTKDGQTAMEKETTKFHSSFSKLIDSLDYMSERTPTIVQGKPIVPIVNELAARSDAFLDLLKKAAATSDESANSDLYQSMNSIQQTIDKLLDVLAMSLPGQAQFNQVSEIINDISLQAERTYNPPSTDASFSKNIQNVVNSVNYLGQHMDHVKEELSSNDASRVANAVVQLANSLQNVVQASVETTQIIAASEQPESPTLPASLNPADFGNTCSKLRQAMKNVLILSKKQNEVMAEVAIIATETNNLRSLLKGAVSSEDVEQTTREAFDQQMQNLAKAMPTYVTALKSFSMNRQSASTAAVEESSKPIEGVISSTLSLVNQWHEQNQPQLSKAVLVKQAPVKAATRTIIEQGRALSFAVKNYCSNTNDPNFKSQLLREVENLAKINSELVTLVKDVVPAQKACEQAIQALDSESEVIGQSYKDIRAGNVQSYILAESTSLDDQIQVLNNLSNVLFSSINGDIAQLENAIEQLPITFTQVDRGIISLAAQSNENVRNELVQSVEQFSTSFKSMFEAIKADKADPSENTHALVDQNAAVAKNALAEMVRLVESQSDQEGVAISAATQRIENAIITIKDTLATAAASSNSSANAEKTTKKLLSELKQALACSKGSFADIASNLAGSYENLVLNCAEAIKSFNDADLQAVVIEQVRELGGSTLKAVTAFRKADPSDQSFKRKMNELLKELTLKSVDLHKSLAESVVAHNAAVQIREEIDLLIADVESSLLFAQAQQLNPDEEGDVFVNSKEAILLAAHDLTDNVKSLVGSTEISQRKISELLTTLGHSTGQTVSLTRKGATALTSSASETQEKLLSAVLALANNTKEIVDAFEATLNDKQQLSTFKKSTETELGTIKKLVDIVKELGEKSVDSSEFLNGILASVDQTIATISSTDPALGSALPAEVIAFAKSLASAAVSVISCATGNSQDLENALNKFNTHLQDLARAGKAAVSCAPEPQKSTTIAAVSNLATVSRKLVHDIQATASLPALARKQALNADIKDVSFAVTTVVQTASSLVPDGYEDPNDPNVIAERELLSAANAIEAAAKKLSLLKPVERPREANESLNFEEQILEGTAFNQPPKRLPVHLQHLYVPQLVCSGSW